MYKIESIFKHKELDCVIIFTLSGHRCGYVGVTKDSPLFNISYGEDLKKPELLKELKQTKLDKRGIIPLFCWDREKVTPEILFNVHGGITYSDKGCYPITRSYEIWWFGFDCAHLNDVKDKQAFASYFPDKELSIYSFTSGSIRTHEYVKQECKNLAEQILCVESTY